jgi:serine/threonine protein kinase
MNSEELAQVDALVEELFDLPRAEQLAVLAKRCDLQPTVRAEAAAILGFKEPPWVQEVVRLPIADILADAGPAERSNAPGGVTPARAPILPGYEALEEVGHGGMGVVYKAHQISPPRIVALKLIWPEEPASETILARFRSEAEAIARVQHPNIVQIFQVGEHLGHPFFVLEFVGGGTLKEHLKNGPLNPNVAAKLVETLARAVAVVHQQGIIHRDLKPANILLAFDTQPQQPGGVANRLQRSTAPDYLLTARPKIADFGLAKDFFRQTDLTLPGTVLGTPGYMSPEQAGGRSGDVGPATDTYALGAILYELLVGHPPFQASTNEEIVRQVREKDPEPLHQLQPACPPDLETITHKCLRKDPQLRYASALELAEDLARFLNKEPILARPVTNQERLNKSTAQGK